jgi:hypothetical protein
VKKAGQEALSLRGAQGEKAVAKRETRSEVESTDKCVCAPKTGQTTKTGRKAGVSNREKEKSEPI